MSLDLAASEARPERWPASQPPAPVYRPPTRRDWRTSLVVVAVGVLLLAVGWFGSPWWATWRLVQDARAGDAAAVARRMDAPLVRESLQPQIESRLRARLARAQPRPGDIWGRLALMLAPAVAAPAAGVAVTPGAVAEAIRHVRSPIPGLPGAPAAAPVAGPGDPRPVRMGYAGQGLDRDWDGFDVLLASRAHPERRLGLHLLRRGLFGWRLVAVDLPAQD